MKATGPGKRLTIYFGESDRWRQEPLYHALLETLRRNGFAGATVVRAVAGFGAHSRIHTSAILRLSEDLPLILELVDAAERVDQALALVGPMVREGLITVEDVQIVKYSHRYLAPLPADRLVRDVMTKPVVATHPQASILDAWDLMIQHHIKALPVTDDAGRPVGMLSDGDLMERTGLVQRLAVAERLDEATLGGWRRALGELTQRVGDIMTHPAEVVEDDSPLGRAAAAMSEHGRKRLPVVDRHGVLAGILSRFDVLAVVSPPGSDQREQPPAGAARTVGEVMDRHLPAVPEDADLPEVMAAMTAAGGSKRVIVIDDAGRPLGLISDGDLVARVRPESRSGLLRALARRGRPPADADLTARQLMSAGVLAVPPEAPIADAIQRALAHRRKRLVVVDGEGRAIGIVDRRDLLRAVIG
jgi:CBS domain-containing protein